jgi:hypothetical protein
LNAWDLAGDSADGSVLFDGADKYQAIAANPSPAAEDKAQLAAELKKHIIFNDHDNPSERTALDSMISRMMDSATAREIAVKFIEADAKATISLEERPNSTVVTVDGKKTIWGSRGYTSYRKNPPAVVLNKFYMQYDSDFGISVLAHEMLGHAFERQRAGDALKEIRYYNQDEEENARLVGWLVATELAVKPEDEIWSYMQNPDESMAAIKFWAPDYAITLTSEEMKNPVPVYKKRLAKVEKSLATLSKVAERDKLLIKSVDHFVNEHKMDPASFRTIRSDIENDINDLPREQKTLTAVRDALRRNLTDFSTSDGKIFLKQLTKAANSDYFKNKDAMIIERRKRLEGLLLGKTQASFRTPPETGQITWDQFSDLIKKDGKCALGRGK